MTTVDWYILIHIICSIVCYGTLFAYFQRKFYILSAKDYWTDFGVSLLTSVLGPFGLIVSYSIARNDLFKYGFKFL